MPVFNSWGLELLVPQLYDLERRVAMEAVDILDEACEEEVRPVPENWGSFLVGSQILRLNISLLKFYSL